MPTGTSIVVSTSPAIRSRANQAAWYSLTICSPGSQRFKRFTVNDSCSLSRSSEIVVLVHAHLHQRSRTHGGTKTILFMPLSLAWRRYRNSSVDVVSFEQRPNCFSPER